MKLNVYMQDNSNITWVREDEFTQEELQSFNAKWVGEVDSENYMHVGMGYYRHIKEG